MPTPDVNLLVVTDSSHRSPRLYLSTGFGKTIAPSPEMVALLDKLARSRNPQGMSFDRSEYQRRTRRRRRRA
jgi:hypothetical protein